MKRIYLSDTLPVGSRDIEVFPGSSRESIAVVLGAAIESGFGKVELA